MYTRLYGQGVVGVGRQRLCWGTEASVGEHVLGGVVENVGGRDWTWSCLRIRLLLQGQFSNRVTTWTNWHRQLQMIQKSHQSATDIWTLTGVRVSIKYRLWFFWSAEKHGYSVCGRACVRDQQLHCAARHKKNIFIHKSVWCLRQKQAEFTKQMLRIISVRSCLCRRSEIAVRKKVILSNETDTFAQGLRAPLNL